MDQAAPVLTGTCNAGGIPGSSPFVVASSQLRLRYFPNPLDNPVFKKYNPAIFSTVLFFHGSNQ